MPKRQFAFEEGGPKRVEVEKPVFRSETVVRLDGRELGRLRGAKEHKAGAEWTLEDGSVLSVKLVANAISRELHVLRNGRPLPGSASDPVRLVRQGAYVLYLVAAFTALFALYPLVVRSDEPDSLATAVGMLVEAGLFGVLGLFTLRRTVWAPALGTALYAGEGLYDLVQSLSTGGRPGNIIVRLLFTIILVRAFQSALTLKREAAVEPPVTASLS